MRDKILELLSSEDYQPMTLKQLQTYFHAENDVQFLKTLATMEQNFEIVRSQKNKYHIPSQVRLYKGVLSLNKKGFGFVKIDGDDEIYVPKQELNGAMHLDEVSIAVHEDAPGRLEGRVVKIFKRGTNRVVGLVSKQGKKFILKCDDSRIAGRIDIDQINGAVVGHKVIAEIKQYEPKLLVDVVKIIGHKNDPGVDIMSCVERYNVPVEFGDQIYHELKSIPDEVLPEELAGRKDFRTWKTFTIDGDDAKDLDDALSIQKLNNGNYQLGVHIADVSHYVKENNAIDQEAVKRGTSIYLVDRVIPMLPHQLSNGICSLNAGVDRLTLSCIMEVNHDGDVVSHDIVPSVIHSSLRMTYAHANEVINGKAYPIEYQPFVEELHTLNELSHILREKRDLKGAINFDTREAKVLLDDQGKVADIVIRERGEAERLIEEMMLLANETVASHMYWLELPYIYRIHEKPLVKKLQKLMTTLTPLGYRLHGSLEDIHPKALQSLLKQSEGTEEHPLVSTMALRCMQKAKYDASCVGHFGLADEFYTHFTSPIRRYPDLLGHRLLHTFLFDGKQDKQTIEFYEGRIPFLAESSSHAERTAVDLERDVEDMKKAEYMSQHIGEVYEGMISSVTRFGFFVELENTCEGLVHISDLLDDYYYFDDFHNALVGQGDGRVYKLLDKVKIKVKAANKTEGTVDFVVVKTKQKKKKAKKTPLPEKPFAKFYNQKRKKRHK